MPPNGIVASSFTVWSLTWTMPGPDPLGEREAARDRARVDGARSPYSLSLASASASSSVSNTTTGATGPKISSRQAGLSGVTSVSTVGR